jgi:hypothetical protein
MTLRSLGARTDSILAGRTPAPARSFTFPVACRQCHHDRYTPRGLDVDTVDHDSHNPFTRIHTRCTRCGRRWTYTVTCTATKPHPAADATVAQQRAAPNTTEVTRP